MMTNGLFAEFLDSIALDHISYAELYRQGENAIQAHLRLKFDRFLRLVEMTQ